MARGLLTALGGARRWTLVAAPVAAVVAAAGAGAAAASGSAPGPVRVGNAPPLASAARTVGAVSARVPMHVTVVLKPRDPAALAAYAQAVSTLGSSHYHDYLTPAQFATRFGAPLAAVRAVQASMRAHGLTPGTAAANRLAVPVKGTAGQIERALSVSFRRVGLRGGRRAIVANAAPALDRAIAGDVQAVVGLSTIAAPKPLLERPAQAGHAATASRATRALNAAGNAPQPCASASDTAKAEDAYTADQIAAAYGLSGLYSQGDEGLGQTVAIYELESYDPNDIAAYQACYGTAATVANVSVDGGGGSGPGSGEAALDIEQAIGLAPRANFLVYTGPNSGSNAPGSGPYDTLNAIVAQDRARVVSTSWGDCEQAQGSDVLSAESTLFEEAAAQGQSVVAATGDSGSEDCNGVGGQPPNELAVDDPGSQPFVTGVGGTTLVASGPPPSETVWNHAGASSGPLVAQGGAGGGGLSYAWDMPGYQSNAPSSLNVIGPDSSGSSCGNYGGHCREVPDVAADADPAKGYVFYWNGSGAETGMPSGWQAVGGTSAGAPLWAALLADADSSSACRGTAIGFANPALYHAAAAGYSSYFNDVVSGDNDYTGANGGRFPAGPGYDMASGLGTPKAGALAAALCADSLRVNNPGAKVSTLGQPVSLRITTSALPGARLQFYASQLPPGLAISKATGRITGRPKKIGKWLTGVAALDQNLSLRAAFFYWQVAGPPSVSSLVLSGMAGGHPKLAFTVGAGRNAPPLKTISIHLSSGLTFGRLGGRVKVTGPRGRRIAVSSRLVGGRLRLTLAAPSSRIRVTIAAGAIRAAARLAADVRRHRPPVVTVSVLTTDSAGHAAPAQARIRPRG